MDARDRHLDDSGEFRRSASRRSEPVWDDDEWEEPVQPRAAARAGRADAATRRPRNAAPLPSTGLRGFLAVGVVFLVTLAAAGAETVLGSGVGRITLVALVVATAVATFLVRRRDLASMLVAPPLVFVAVAVTATAIRSSAHVNLAAIASLLIRGFPTMGIATAVGLLIALFRLATRR